MPWVPRQSSAYGLTNLQNCESTDISIVGTMLRNNIVLNIVPTISPLYKASFHRIIWALIVSLFENNSRIMQSIFGVGLFLEYDLNNNVSEKQRIEKSDIPGMALRASSASLVRHNGIGTLSPRYLCI